MNKQKLLRPVNITLGCLFICVVTTALLDDVIPSDVYSVLHPVLGYSLAVCALSHIYLNWNWIKMNILRKPAK
jgi:hypothetical protein